MSESFIDKLKRISRERNIEELGGTILEIRADMLELAEEGETEIKLLEGGSKYQVSDNDIKLIAEHFKKEGFGVEYFLLPGKVFKLASGYTISW